jgi:5-methylcytosine-specific restriction protein A
MKAKIKSQQIEDVITERFGIEFSTVVGDREGYPLLTIRPVDLRAPNGFSIEAHARWRSFAAAFVPDSFANDLLIEMAKALPEKKVAFSAFASAIQASGAKLSIRVNDLIAVLDLEHWPEPPWKNFSLSMERMGVVVDDDESDPNNTIIDLVSPFIGMVASLLPLEHEESAFVQSEPGLPEGAKLRVEVNRYERSPLNRQACLSIFGARCKGCGISFGEKYGQLGDGYIHVHHIVPVSELGAGYIVNPAKDLVPVCPNCHAMLHRADPPLRIEDLRVITGYSG